MNKFYALLLLAAAFVSCEKEDDTDSLIQPAGSAESYTIKNLAADTGNTGHFTFFNLETGTEVALADSNSTNWHIAFKTTSIILNGGVSGPGSTSGQMQTGVFDEMSTAPSSGYKTDSAEELVIPIGSGNGWYNYNQEVHVISPIPGRVLFLKTSEGYYAKLEILSYYKDAPAEPDFTMTSGLYSFRYTIQKDKTTQF